MKNVRPKNKESIGDLPPKGKRIRSKDKGDRYEQWLARFFREELGYTFAKTTRNSSKMLDDCGVDISGVPYLPQAKSGYWKYRPKPDVLFKGIREALNCNYDPNDPVHGCPPILFHKLDGHHPSHHLVTVEFDFFIKLIKAYERQRDNQENLHER